MRRNLESLLLLVLLLLMLLPMSAVYLSESESESIRLSQPRSAVHLFDFFCAPSRTASALNDISSRLEPPARRMRRRRRRHYEQQPTAQSPRTVLCGRMQKPRTAVLRTDIFEY